MSGLSLIDVWYRRLPRYLFIEERLRDQAVLELGCGSGLGADFLIDQGAARVVGVDTDERQILKARARGLEVGPILMGMGNRAHIVTPSITARGLLNMAALAGTPVANYG